MKWRLVLAVAFSLLGLSSPGALAAPGTLSYSGYIDVDGAAGQGAVTLAMRVFVDQDGSGAQSGSEPYCDEEAGTYTLINGYFRFPLRYCVDFVKTNGQVSVQVLVGNSQSPTCPIGNECTGTDVCAGQTICLTALPAVLVDAVPYALQAENANMCVNVDGVGNYVNAEDIYAGSINAGTGSFSSSVRATSYLKAGLEVQAVTRQETGIVAVTAVDGGNPGAEVVVQSGQDVLRMSMEPTGEAWIESEHYVGEAREGGTLAINRSRGRVGIGTDPIPDVAVAVQGGDMTGLAVYGFGNASMTLNSTAPTPATFLLEPNGNLQLYGQEYLDVSGGLLSVHHSYGPDAGVRGVGINTGYGPTFPVQATLDVNGDFRIKPSEVSWRFTEQVKEPNMGGVLHCDDRCVGIGSCLAAYRTSSTPAQIDCSLPADAERLVCLCVKATR